MRSLFAIHRDQDAILDFMTTLAQAPAVSEKFRNIMADLRGEMENLYGERLVKLVLFGSQARGDARWWSDVDVMVVLKGPVVRSEERYRTETILGEVSLRHEAVVSCKFVDDMEFAERDSFLVQNVWDEGVEL